MSEKKRESSARKVLSRAALVFASLCFTFLLLEIALRLVAPSSPPGTTYGKTVTKNSLGLRDREFAIPKPPGTYRIVMLGDSFTWGVGLDVDQALPKVLEKELARRHGQVEVVNASEPGHNTVEELLLLEEKGLRYQPDMVVLVYNLNDIEFLPQLSEKVYDQEPMPVVEIDPGEDITMYSRNAGLRGLVLAVERRSVLVRFLVPRLGAVLRRVGLIDSVEVSWVEKIYQGFDDANPGWIESKRALTRISELCRSRGCDFLVAVYPLFAELENYKGRHAHRSVVELCQQHGIQAIDLLPLFENTRSSSHWINFMDSHPDAEAHRAVAEALVPLITESRQLPRN